MFLLVLLFCGVSFASINIFDAVCTNAPCSLSESVTVDYYDSESPEPFDSETDSGDSTFDYIPNTTYVVITANNYIKRTLIVNEFTDYVVAMIPNRRASNFPLPELQGEGRIKVIFVALEWMNSLGNTILIDAPQESCEANIASNTSCTDTDYQVFFVTQHFEEYQGKTVGFMLGALVLNYAEKKTKTGAFAIYAWAGNGNNFKGDYLSVLAADPDTDFTSDNEVFEFQVLPTSGDIKDTSIYHALDYQYCKGDNYPRVGERRFSVKYDFQQEKGKVWKCIERPGIIASAVIVPIVMIAAYVVGFLLYRRWKRSKNIPKDVEMEKKENLEQKSERKSEIKLDMDKITKITDIQVLEKISEGNFGDVFKGKWGDTFVALKRLKSEDISLFEREAKTLFNISSHPHVVQFFGLYTSPSNESYLVMEYMSKGSLLTTLRDDKKSFHFVDLLEIITGMSSGMAFLEKKKIIHRDLACRNLLLTKVDDKFRVKVSDFGLSKGVNFLLKFNNKGLDDKNYYKPTEEKPVPVRWSAPEVLEKNAFSVASDVWAFGVTAWEYGKTPYNWMNNKEVTISIPKGERLPKPEICPEELWNIIVKCFETVPEKRPSFKDLSKDLQELKAKLINDADEKPISGISNMSKEEEALYNLTQDNSQ